MSALEQANEELIVGLYDRQALLFSDFEFTLRSKRKSPVYYDQRAIVSVDAKSNMERDYRIRIRRLAVEAYADGIDKLNKPYNHLFCIPQSMTPLGSMVAYAREDSLLWGRVGEKSYGAHAAIEGDFEPGDEVVALDDGITDAKSKEEAADSITSAGLRVNGFVIMFDREEGGAEKLSEAGYQMVAIIGLTHAMEVLKGKGRIGNQEFEWVDKYQGQLEADGII